MKADLPTNESLRLKTLHDLAILDSPREQNFDDLAQVAMQLCGTAIGVISLIDADRQWFKSCLGLEARETSRDIAFCAHAILAPDEVLMVTDATKDSRFADNPFVIGEPYVRSYAGAPLVTENGIALGTLCVIDYQPRTLSAEQIASLKALARQVVQLLRLRSAHDVIQHNEQLLGSLLSNFPGAAYRCENNPRWSMHYLSDAVKQLTGYPASDFLVRNMRSFTDIIHPDDIAYVNDAIQRAIAERKSFDLQYRIQHADGQWRCVQEIGRGIFNSLGEVEFLDGFIWDIQARIDSEKEKFVTTAKLSQLFEMAPIGILQVNENAELIDSNPEFIRMMGYSVEELKGISFLNLTPEFDWEASQQAITALKTTGRFGPMEKHYRHKNGELIPVEVSGSMINIGQSGAQCWWTLVKDIREQKRIERMKSEFISTVSHELRTPLTSISGALGLIASNVLGELPEKAKSMLDIAYKNSQRLSVLINDLLDMEKLLAGKMPFDSGIQAVLPLVQQAIVEISSYADKYSVKLVLHDASDGALIDVDGFRLQQVLHNFLSNAAKYSPPQAVVDVDLTINGEWLRISVRDHGLGIADEFKAHMFQKFSQADSSDRRQKGGTGLGLAISKELVERMGGRIGFESELGQGACFFAEFKVVKKLT
jgi:PAS domain S-box-containing protein